LRARSCRRAGTPAAGGGGRRGCLSGEVGARLVVRKGRRARGEEGEVVARLLWRAAGRSWQLAVAACLAPEDDTVDYGGSARRGGRKARLVLR
jgi:hypothetical protein